MRIKQRDGTELVGSPDRGLRYAVNHTDVNSVTLVHSYNFNNRSFHFPYSIIT